MIPTTTLTKLEIKMVIRRSLLGFFLVLLYGQTYGQTCPLPSNQLIFDEQCIIFDFGPVQFPFTSQGFIGAASCDGLGTPEYSSNMGPFSPTVPPYSKGLKLETRCDCSGTPGVSPATGSGSTVMTSNRTACWIIPIRFFDPCDCTNPLNCFDNGIQYNHDTLVVDLTDPAAFGGSFPPGTEVGASVTISSASNDFLSEPPCTNGSAVPHALGNTFIETSPGVYKLEFWKTFNGSLPTVEITVDLAGPIFPVTAEIPQSTFASHISPDCDCTATAQAAIPTMSEWGLIIFGILIMNLGLIFVYQREQIVATNMGSLSISSVKDIFDKKTLIKYFLIVLTILTLLFSGAIYFSCYSLMPFDIPGSIITSGLVACFIQLIYPTKKS